MKTLSIQATLYLISFCTISFISFGQLGKGNFHFELYDNTPIDSSKNYISSISDKTISSVETTSLVFVDSLDERQRKYSDFVRVPTERSLERQYDSVKNLARNRLEVNKFQKGVLKEEMLDAVNMKFVDTPSDDPLAMKNNGESYKGKYQNELSGQYDSIENLNSENHYHGGLDTIRSTLHAQIISEEMLPPLSGQIIKFPNDADIDTLKAKKIKFKNSLLIEQKNISASQKSVTVKNLNSFLDRTYFEGIISFTEINTTNVYQVSPGIGYHILDGVSLGAGPLVTLGENTNKTLSQIRIRTFSKVEFFKGQVYLQLEDSFGRDKDESEDSNFFVDHKIYAGGGFLLSLTTKISINLCMLYHLNSKQVEQNNKDFPLSFRVGISSIKVRK